MPNSKEIYFNIDARILYQLGEQLVTDRSVALAELIKNAYDADASIVNVAMEKITQPGGYILIKDNGEGMNSHAFEENWMRIATIDKKKNPISNKYGRKKAGEKGIGRFACRRLSKKLLLKSVTLNKDGKKEQLNATFNWENFKPGDDLIKIPINYSVEIVNSDIPTGTALYLHDTHDSWNRSDIKKLKLELLDLFTPDTLIRTKKKIDAEDDPGFNVEFDIPDFPDKAEALDYSFYKNAWAELDGEIDENGTATYEIVYKNAINKKEKNEYKRSENYSFIKNLKLKCYIFSYKPEYFGSSEFGMNKAQDIGRERGGIKLYSDKFRIFGYGRSGDDWLKVDYDRARSVSSVDSEIMDFREEKVDRPGLRIFQNRNLFGHVIFEKDENPLLEITVNRDSLIENEAFEELRHFARLGIDFSTVLYSNIVFKQEALKKEKKRNEEEAAKKAAIEEKQKLENQKKKAEEEAKLAKKQKEIAEERASIAEEARRNAEKDRRQAEEARRKAEEARRKAEEARRKAEKENVNREEIEKRRTEEEKARIEEEEKRKVEEEARKKEEEARKKAEEEEHKAKEEQGKQRKANEDAEQKRKKIEEEERRKIEEEIKSKEKKLEEEIVLLRVLASTGTMMLIFQHELQGLTEEMESLLISIRRTIAGKGDKFLENIIDSYYTQVEMVKELGKLMGSIINSESRLQKKDWVILPIVNDVVKPFSSYINKVGAKIESNIPDYLRTPIMYRSELISIIHNLITNSIKAIRTTREKQIEIRAFEENNEIIIHFLDTGKGLEKEKWAEVFSPFISYSEPDLRFGTGTGLGLKIVQDMVRSYNGDVKFIDAPKGWVTCIELKLPKEKQ
jgi:signal transduction histidine kinase